MYVFLYAFWLILCGTPSAEKSIAGLVPVVIVALLAKVLFGYGPKDEWLFWKRFPFLIAYAVLLIGEIVKANLAMLSYIYKPSKPLEPSLVRLDTDLSTKLGRFLLANCITLTPGTITVRLEGNRLYIHALHPGMLEGLSESAVLSVLKRMEAIA